MNRSRAKALAAWVVISAVTDAKIWRVVIAAILVVAASAVGIATGLAASGHSWWWLWVAVSVLVAGVIILIAVALRRRTRQADITLSVRGNVYRAGRDVIHGGDISVQRQAPAGESGSPPNTAKGLGGDHGGD
jgi:predicted phage tail protein